MTRIDPDVSYEHKEESFYKCIKSHIENNELFNNVNDNLQSNETCFKHNSDIEPHNSDRFNLNISENVEKIYITSLNVISWNIQGIGKKFEIEDIRKLIVSNDIVFLLETMKLNSFDLYIEGFRYFHCERKFQHPKAKRASGGIAVLIKNSLLNKMVSIVKHDEYAIWIKIEQNRGYPIFLAGIYIPPHGSRASYNIDNSYDPFDILKTDISNFLMSSPNIFLCGDFNSRCGSCNDYSEIIHGRSELVCEKIINPFRDIIDYNDIWHTTKRVSIDKVHNAYGKELTSICKMSDLRIMNGFYNSQQTNCFTCYTSFGQSTIDYLLCSENAFNILNNFEILSKMAESDHRPLLFSFKTLQQYQGNDNIELVKDNNLRKTQTNTRCFNYVFDHEKIVPYAENLKSDRSKQLITKLKNNIGENISTDDVVDIMYEYVINGIEPVFKKKYKKSDKNTFPRNVWYDADCKNMRKMVNYYAKHNDISQDHFRIVYRQLHRSYKMLLQQKKRHFQKCNRDSLFRLMGKYQSDCWKQWKRFTKKPNIVSEKVPNLEKFQVYFTEESKLPECDYFRNNSTLNLNNIVNVHDPISTEICDSKITESEIYCHLKKLRNNKAVGVDGIPAECYKYATDYYIDPFCNLFNYVFDKGEYPTQWSQGIINALHKKGDLSVPDNYRKITINVVMSKIFECILNSRLYMKNEVLGLDDPFQFGFTPSSRTSDCVFIIDTIAQYQESKNSPLYMCLVDFKKAFDYINRKMLYYKLKKRCIGEKMLNILISMYDKSCARVRCEGILGDEIHSLCGVLQGGVLSPKLFNEYLSDISEYLDKENGIEMDGDHITHILYADDLVLLSNSSAGLQHNIDRLFEFCKDWHLIVNTSKTKIMVLGKAPRNNIDYFFNDNKIEKVNTYKYLGHVLSNKKNIHSDMQDYIINQANKAIFSLRCDTKHSLGYIPPKLALQMFDTYVLPIIEYNNILWSKIKQNNDIERIQLSYLKSVLGVRKQTPSMAVYGETGRFPLNVRLQVNLLKYWIRLETLPDNNILFKCLKVQKTLSNMGPNNWFFKIKKIFHENDFTLPQIQDDRQLYKTLNDMYIKIYEQAQKDIMSSINNSDLQPKLRTYKLFKLDFRLEPYLTMNFEKHIYSSIAKFRTSSHHLRIETGRHDRPFIPADQRFCLKCASGEVEDEIHHLINCQSLSDKRNILFNIAGKQIDNFQNKNPLEKFLSILTSKDRDVLKSLGIFLNEKSK